MSARLIPLTDRSVSPISVQRPVMLLGRHPECDVRLDLPEVSRRHCCLAQAYDRILIRDLGSRNGVRVNGRLVDEARLAPGDEVAIAHILFRVEGENSGPGSPAPSPDRSPLPDLPGSSDDDLIPLVDD